MAKARGDNCVNVRNGKTSHISLHAPTGALFNANSGVVDPVTDTVHSLTFNPSHVKINNARTIMKFKITGNYRDARDFLVDAGTLAITLTNIVGTTIDPSTDMPVTYVDDNS